MKKKIVLIASASAAVFLLLLTIVFVCIFVPNRKYVNIFPQNVTSLVIEGNIIQSKEPPIYDDDQVLLPFNIVKEYLDKNIFWESKSQKVIITTTDKVIKLDAGKLQAYINGKPIDIKSSVKIVADKVYVPIDFLKDVYRIDIKYNKKNNVIIIDYRDTIKKNAEVISKKAYIRNQMSIKAPIVKRVKENDALRVFDEYEKWYKVRTDEGYIGYIEKKYIKITALTSSVYTEDKQLPAISPASKILNGKLNLVWDCIEKKTPEMSGVSKINGLDIISPTWFKIEKKGGSISSKADLKYVKWAKAKGYSIWPLFSNNSDTALTSQVLNDSSSRDKIISQIMAYVKLYKFEGINVDFENMSVQDKDVFSQFIRELAPPLRQQGIVLSVDIGVPGGSDNWSRCYDRKALAEAADYIMVMTYDQHWGTSPESGSVAQYAWVEEKLKQTLRDIPASKLFLGLAFYTREWKEKHGSDGKMVGKPASIAISMQQAEEDIKKNKAAVTWDESSGQYYAEYKKGSYTYKIWIEDENSINLKSSLVHKYQLAGAASWRRGFELKNVWTVLQRNLKNDINYTQWAKANSDYRNR